MRFYYYLNLVCGFSQTTCNIYTKYAKELEENQLDYYKVLIGHKNASNNTKRVIISAIKKYYEFLNDPRKNELKLPKKEKNIYEHITFDEYKKMQKYLESKKTHNSKLCLVVISVLFETGIRSSELLSITKDDIFNDRILINGKNSKQRIVYLSKQLSKKLLDFSKDKNKYIFNFKYKNLYKKINGLGKKVLNKSISPHMFRRGFATHCSKNNIDIYDICMLMGHENINTTKMYIKKEINKDFFKIFN